MRKSAPNRSSLETQSLSVMVAIALSGVVVSSCSTSSKLPSEVTVASSSSTVASNLKSEDIDALIAEINGDVEATQRERSDATSADISRIPREVNREVEQWLRYFSEKDRARFQVFLSRGGNYRKTVETILAEEGVPKDLFYLALIESGFQVHAHSHASAVGPWQFIKPTGERYGLVINSWVDERRDIIRSTRAAARYLRDLHNVFQSWFLAMAAYNAGESRIMSAIMRAKTRDFWELARKGALPRETMNYVPKFIAASVIGHHAEKFGFTTAAEDELVALAAIDVPSRARLESVANAANVTTETLRRYNPHILRYAAPDHQPSYNMWLPATIARNLNHETFAYVERAPVEKVRLEQKIAKAKLKTVPAFANSHNKIAQNLKAKKNHKKSVAYVVKPGDSLHSIAKRFGVQVQTIKSANKLRQNKIKPGQMLTVLTNPSKGFKP